jgi:hypothetical protein
MLACYKRQVGKKKKEKKRIAMNRISELNYVSCRCITLATQNVEILHANPH